MYSFGRFRRLAIAFIVLLAVGILFSAVVPQVRADSIYLIPDTLGNTIFYSMAVNNGKPVLAYYSSTTNQIVIAICGDTSCQTDLTVIRPIEAINLQSIAVTFVGINPFIAYSTSEYPAQGHLRVAACVDPTCSQTPFITTLATGNFVDITLTARNGKALITYDKLSQFMDHNIIGLAVCNNTLCTAPTLRTFSGTDGASSGTGLGLGILNGNPIIAYTTWHTGNALILIMCASPTCAETPDLKTVDAGYLSLSGIALTMSDTTPIITYTAVEPYYMWVKAATCTDAACNDPMYLHIVDQGNYRQETSVTLVNGLPVIAYHRDGVRMATCLDVVCNYASSTLIADEYHFQPIIRAVQNYPVISFLQMFPPSPTELMKVYYGGDSHPAESPTPSNTPTETPMQTMTYPTPTATIPTITPSITPTPSFTFTPSNTPTHTPTPITPTSPANAHPIPNYSTSDSVTLTWNRVAGAYGYQVQLDDAPDFQTPFDTQDLSADTLQHTTDSLDNGMYYWRVCAKNGSDVCGAWSAVQVFTVSAEP